MSASTALSQVCWVVIDILARVRVLKWFSLTDRRHVLEEVDASGKREVSPVILEATRKSYEKAFSSILVPFALLTVGEEVGQGE